MLRKIGIIQLFQRSNCPFLLDSSDLGYCFDLTDSTYLQELKAAYEAMVTIYKESGIELPKNTSIGNSTDLLIRK